MYLAAAALNIIGSAMCIMGGLFDMVLLAVIGGVSIICALIALCVVLMRTLS